MNTFKSRSWLVALAMLTILGCKKKESTTPDEGGTTDRYFIAAVIGSATYTMAVDDLEKDITINTSTAIENTGTFTHYGYSGNSAVFAINYQQGNPAPGAIFQLNAAGVLKKMDEFVLPGGFNTIGSFDKYLGAAANTKTLTGTNNGKIGSVFYLIDLQNNNTIAEKSIPTENTVIPGRTTSFVGIADAGDGSFLTGLNLTAPTGGIAVSPDSIYVAKMDANLNVQRIYKDNRISFSGGQMRSARYGQIDNDADGNTYVFSTGYGATTKKAGALLIKKGATSFDASYHFDIETASGGYKFRKVWHITEDYFLLEMYNETGLAGAGSQSPANQFAVIKMANKEFKWVRNGYPELAKITGSGWPFTANGKAYVSVLTTDAQPAIYSIDPKTAVAKKGITVSGVTSIPGIAKLSPQSSIQ